MLLNRLRRVNEKNRNEFLGIFLHRYPAFVWSDAEPDDIPAFVFHDVTPEALKPLLEYLTENRYTTLTADEYVERASTGEHGAKREVLLTFDDSHESLYSVAYPLLQRYGQKAVAYVVPGRIENSRTSGTFPLCNWPQIREMNRTGVIDIQSHSMFHHSIPISSCVVDFVRPGLNFSFLNGDFAPVREKESIQESGFVPFGYPIHDWGARMREAPAYMENTGVINTCIDYVASRGGEEFFRMPGGRRTLRAVLKDSRLRNPPGRFENEDEQRIAMLEDFIASKREIERQLPGKNVRHYCFPWFRGSRLASALSFEAGYVSNAWGSLVSSTMRYSEEKIWHITRLPCRYIFRLPGRGRRGLSRVLTHRA